MLGRGQDIHFGEVCVGVRLADLQGSENCKNRFVGGPYEVFIEAAPLGVFFLIVPGAR